MITGVMAAGKSTVAELLAQRFERSVHVRGDVFRKMILSGRAEVTPELEEEAVVQLELRRRIAARVVEEYWQAGFDVVVQDILIGNTFAGLPVDARSPSSLRGRADRAPVCDRGP